MSSLKKTLNWISLALTLGFVAYICAFKLLDRDFWWHIKAGEIMLRTHALIHNEIFSYIRFGKPYLATHEWLAQIILYLVYHFTGANGIIVFRTLMMAFTLLVLLWIDRRALWPNGLLAILAANSLKRGFIERPQLFTYAIFAMYLWLACRYLEEPPEHGRRRRILWAFVVLEALWVNLHGAASLMGLGVVGALLIQEYSVSGKALLLTLGGMLVAFFVSPNTYRNFTYLSSLMTDKTIAFIGEWQPRELSVYLREIGPFWALGLAGLAVGRRGRLFSLLVFAATGYLSIKAFRHEMLFVLAATGVTIFQLKHSPIYQGWLERALAQWKNTLPVYGLALVFLTMYVRADYFAFCQKDHLFGYGVFDLAKGSYEFLEREHVQGNMFNTDGIGGYLSYRGYPHRPIYMDGRNVEFGFETMYNTYFAGEHPELWQELEDRYQFTYAIIDYDAIEQKGRLPYVEHLGKNPHWQLVYLDDWAGIYLKKIPANQAIIEKDALRLVSPESLEDRGWSDALPSADVPRAEKELARVVAENPDGVKGRLALARLDLRMGKFDEAGRWVEEARLKQPYRAEVYEVQAAAAVAQQRWAEAGRSYETMIRYAGSTYPNINYAYIAGIFEKAGQPYKAEKYRKKAGPAALSAPPAPAAPAVSESPAPAASEILPAGSMPKSNPKTQKLAEKLRDDLFSGIEKEKQEHNDRGVDYAQKGELGNAREEFETAIKMDPGYPEALNNLGSVFYQEKKWEDAIRYYRRALERNPKYGEARYNLARALAHAGKYDEALTEAEESSRLGQDTARLIETLQHAKQSK